MPSNFKGLDLFGSGPHRFAVRRQGQLLVPELALGNVTSGTRYLGPLEREVVVTGRLIADDDDALWALRDAITEALLHPPDPGTLEDHHGRRWPDMSFVRFEPADRTDRARRVSITYTAAFVDFLTYPQ